MTDPASISAPTTFILVPFDAGSMVYTKEKLSQHRDQMIRLRDGALEAGAMDWAVIVSHNIAILTHFISMFPEE